ncbi:ankyrin repeat domain-containing protein 65-like [Dendrobium catenatum]|uniref:E3 ubiquitin-protein ligase KEG n=1 Tax=Dendrobium catenatum TaxID=906689 RepID=A0A2I0W1W0_9ASPA|nr:ankyrin repeat domain-containing protein 65-like [Dendrobium catenatum]PKU69646.1 E3 ubiquitin-protein ligase KEG [Dendrobium catenatum]
MDRLIRIEPTNEVTVRLEPGQRSYGVFTLRNVMYTMPVAFRLLPLNRNRFSIRPQTGIIAPLATLTVEITYLAPLPPAPFLPDSAPESDDSFFLDSVVSPGASFKDGASATALDAVPADWFTAKKKQVFTDSALRIFYVGSAVLARLVDTGDMEKVREVLERSDPAWRAADSSDASGESLLHLAISRSRADLAQLVLEFGADVEARSRTGRSPLEAAAAAGETLIAELLLARGASTERSSGSPLGPIHLAAAGGHTELLRLLLLKGAAPEATAADGRTALHLAAAEQRRECVGLLLSAGSRADVCGGAAKETPLHLAAAAGDEATARLLISSGCAGLREARNGAGKTAFDVAAEEGQRRLFDMLKAGESLAAAARSGDVSAVVRAIEMGAAVDGRDGLGWTALMRAGFKGRVEIMRILIEKGAALDARDEAGYTALHCAVEAGQVEAVEVLVKRGTDVEARTAKGKTAVEIATALGYAGLVRILVQGGAVAAQGMAAPAVAQIPLPPAKEKLGKGRVLMVKEKEKKGKRKGGSIVAGARRVTSAGFVDQPVAMAVASY